MWLVGLVAMRWSGPLAGLSAAVLYGTYAEVVKVERGPFLEPVLNLLCLTLAWVWLRSERPGRGWSAVSGVLCGAACAVKVWGGIWFIAALASLPHSRRREHAFIFVATAALTGILLIAPLALAAPEEFVNPRRPCCFNCGGHRTAYRDSRSGVSDRELSPHSRFAVRTSGITVILASPELRAET